MLYKDIDFLNSKLIFFLEIEIFLSMSINGQLIPLVFSTYYAISKNPDYQDEDQIKNFFLMVLLFYIHNVEHDFVNLINFLMII